MKDIEYDAAVKFYELLDKYTEEIYHCFVNGEKFHWPVANYSLLQAAYYPQITNRHGEKALLKLYKIIMNNIPRANVTTILAGHTPNCPIEHINELGLDGSICQGEDWENFLDGILIDETGEIRISDYAIEPLNKLWAELFIAEEGEWLPLIDRVLNVVHWNGDIAAWFVKGGTKTLDKLSGNK